MTSPNDVVSPTPPAPGAAAERARFPALDGLRGLAALAVIGTHVGFNSGRSVDGGWLGSALSRLEGGVTVFFLLSGFLLYRPFALHLLGGRPLPNVRDFLVRRALRIFPALWVMVTITLAGLTSYSVRAIDWVSYLTLVQNYDDNGYDRNLTHLWTLGVEISFYAAIPVLAWLASGRMFGRGDALRRQLVMLASLVVLDWVFVLAQAHGLINNRQSLLWLPAYLDWFAAGMFLAVLSCIPPDALGRAGRTLHAWAAAPGTCFLVAAVTFAIVALPIGVPRNLAPATHWQWSIQHELMLVVAFFVMLPLVVGPSGPAHRLLGSAPGRVLGDLSYGIYLWHVPLMLLILKHTGIGEFDGHFWLLLVLTIAASVAAAAVSWYGFERRILRYGRRWGRRRELAPTITAASATRLDS